MLLKFSVWYVSYFIEIIPRYIIISNIWNTCCNWIFSSTFIYPQNKNAGELQSIATAWGWRYYMRMIFYTESLFTIGNVKIWMLSSAKKVYSLVVFYMFLMLLKYWNYCVSSPFFWLSCDYNSTSRKISVSVTVRAVQNSLRCKNTLKV